MAWRLSAEAGKVIKTGRNDTRRENAHCGTKSAPERWREVGGGGRKERSISKSEIVRLVFIESNDAPMTQSLGEVEHLEEIAKRLSRPVEVRRSVTDVCVLAGCLTEIVRSDSRHTSIFLDTPRFLDIARSSSICLAGFSTGYMITNTGNYGTTTRKFSLSAPRVCDGRCHRSRARRSV
jgi:hypothetical protein